MMSKNMAPSEENKFRVVLELTGAASGDDRPGVDIVTILDVCGSMKEERLDKLKTAFKILIRKLPPVDRLSIITFSRQGIFTKTTQLQTYPLHTTSEVAQKKSERIVNALQHVNDVPSIVAALESALDMLGARDDASDRSAAILIMSDGDPRRDHGDATSLPLDDVPLYKFTFAHEYEADGLHAIGKRNNGGTFPLADVDDLNVAFSQCLDELSEFVVEDLELRFTPVANDDEEISAVIEKVYAGNCQQSTDDITGSVTVSMNGQFYREEIRRLMVDLLLPDVSKQMTTRVLEITHSYTIRGERFVGLAASLDVIRTGKPLENAVKEQALEENLDSVEGNNTENMLDIKYSLGFFNLVVKGTTVILYWIFAFSCALGVGIIFDTINKKEEQPETNDASHGLLPPQEISPQPVKTEENNTSGDEEIHPQQVATPPDKPLSLELEHLKQQILMAIKYLDSIQDTLKSIDGTLNKAIT